MERLEPLDPLVTVENLDLLDQQVNQDRQALLDHVESVDLQEREAHLESVERLDLLEPQVFPFYFHTNIFMYVLISVFISSSLNVD